MDIPFFSDSQFLDQTVLNSAFGLNYASAQSITSLTNSPGIINAASLVFTPSSLTVSVGAPAPFAVLFGNGVLTGAHGTTTGADTTTTSVNLASLVPGSGSVTAYIVAQAAQVQETPYEVVGPPAGHPDYNPSFSAYTAYAETRDTLAISATTTVPNNTTIIELCRTTLTAGQTSITTLDSTHRVFASSLLAPTGVGAGAYAGATVTVGVDGRITGISSVVYGPLAVASNWTAIQTYTIGILLNNNIFLSAKQAGGAVQSVLGLGVDNFVKIFGGPSGWGIINNAATFNNVQGDDAGNVVIRAGVQSSGFDPGGFNVRTTSTHYGFGLRNDDANGYLLITNSGAPTGAFNTLRPLSVNLSTGAVTLDSTGVGVTTGGVLTAGNKLRATFGATGTGDANCATILADFTRSYTGINSGFTKLPDGTIELVTTASISAGGGLVTTIVALPPGFFPNNILEASVCFLGNTPPGASNPGSISIQPNSPTTVAVTSSYATAQVLGVQIKARGF